MKNIGLTSLVFVLILSGVFYFSTYGTPNITMPSISVPNIDFNKMFPSKDPSTESPKGNDAGTTITVLKETTTVKKTTTTSTTSTTRKKPTPDGRNSGFYTYQKEAGVVYTDCNFDGKGHDAVLMPSGNYYCRSSEQRLVIQINGVDKVCCVTP
jgi:hypothetical protein